MKTTMSALGGLAVALLLACSSPALAQGWGAGGWVGGGPRMRSTVGYARIAFDNGFRRGYLVGERDARRGRFSPFRGHPEFRRGDWGFGPRFGPRDQYRLAFRDGFEAGYREALRRHRRAGAGFWFGFGFR